MKLRFGRVDLVLLLMVIFWGANISIVKLALVNFHPMVFNCMRFLLGSSIMMILYRKVLGEPFSRRQLFSLLLLGILGNVVYQFLFIYGVEFTLASHVSILLGTGPIFTAAISDRLKLEHVSKGVWFGILLSFCGVVLIVLGRGAEIGFDRGTVGDLLILLASLVWAFYTSLSRSFVSGYSSAHYVLYTVVFGTMFLVPLSLPFFAKQNWELLGIGDWAAVVYSSLFALVFGYSAWYYGVQHLGSTRTSAYANLTPVAGMAIGMLLLGERFNFLQWLGALIIFASIILNRLSQPVKDVEPVPVEG